MNKPSRRAVVRTGVWTVPVVAAAAAAPAMAAVSTTPPPVVLEPVGASCKLPGNSTDVAFGYRMVVTFCNTTTSAQTVTLVNLAISGKATDGFPTGSSFTLKAGECADKLFIVTSSASSQRTATISYKVGTQTYTQDVTFPSFDPCKCDPKDADPANPASDCS